MQSRSKPSAMSLKPCPFCQSCGEKLIELWDHFDDGHIAYVHCTCCGTHGPSVYSEIDAGYACTLARRKWNGRP